MGALTALCTEAIALAPSPVAAATLCLPKTSSAQVEMAIRSRRGLDELTALLRVRSLRHDGSLCCSGWPT
jgi:hypothetical protein